MHLLLLVLTPINTVTPYNQGIQITTWNFFNWMKMLLNTAKKWLCDWLIVMIVSLPAIYSFLFHPHCISCWMQCFSTAGWKKWRPTCRKQTSYYFQKRINEGENEGRPSRGTIQPCLSFPGQVPHSYCPLVWDKHSKPAREQVESRNNLERSS